MAIDNFIATIWSALLLENLRTALVLSRTGVVNFDYEGEVRSGNTVKINNIGPVTVFDVTKNADIPAPETLTDEQRSLLIDQQKGFNFLVDDIDAAQQNPKVMASAMREAAYALALVQDRFIASKYTDAAAANAVGSTASPVAITASNAYSTLTKMGTKLDEGDIPEDGRWAALPPAWCEALANDEKFVGHGTTENRQALQNGSSKIGRAAGFDIYKSNNIVKLTGGDAGKNKAMFGHPMAITLANQIEKIEPYRPESRFADAVKGLHVYGGKVVRPKALGCATVTFS